MRKLWKRVVCANLNEAQQPTAFFTEPVSAAQELVCVVSLYLSRRVKRAFRRGECAVPGVKQPLWQRAPGERGEERRNEPQPLPAGPNRALDGNG